jgi:hypothetical protein
MRKHAIEQEALTNAVTRQSVMNYPGIFEGFMARGIPEQEIRPRENVFTYNAWRALGRHVRSNGAHRQKDRRERVLAPSVDNYRVSRNTNRCYPRRHTRDRRRVLR